MDTGQKNVQTRTKEEERKDRSAALNSDLHKMLSKVGKMGNKTVAKGENSLVRCKLVEMGQLTKL